MTDNNTCCKCLNDNNEEEVTRQRCSHVICWKCLSEHILPRLAPKLKCPVPGCQRYLSDGAIRKVLSDEETERYEQLMLDKVPQMIKCLLPECPYVFIWGSTDGQFDCSECSMFNCLRCSAAHRFMTCEQFMNNDESQQYCLDEIRRARKKLKVRNSKTKRAMFKEMDETDIFVNDTYIDCTICCKTLAKGDGVILRCTHVFCRYCLNSHISTTFTIPIPCPSDVCKKPMFEREIQSLLSEEDLTKYIGSCSSVVKGRLDLTFQCQTPNCVFFMECSIKPDVITCPLCKEENCTKCFDIHTNETCAKFRNRIKNTPKGIDKLKIEEQIRNKEIMRCLKCQQLLKKIAGCSWIQCSNCKFEMCWALQIRRWGPKGRGDVSDGCKCGVNGFCTEDCGSCIPHHTLSDIVPNNLQQFFQTRPRILPSTYGIRHDDYYTNILGQLQQDTLNPPRPYIAPTPPNPPNTNDSSCSIS